MVHRDINLKYEPQIPDQHIRWWRSRMDQNHRFPIQYITRRTGSPERAVIGVGVVVGVVVVVVAAAVVVTAVVVIAVDYPNAIAYDCRFH
jgi:hypothetical protein